MAPGMKAVRFHTHGGPEVLVYEDAPDPEPGPGDALVRVRACALNHLDLWVRRGIDRLEFPLPHIPGSDVAGEVVSAGGVMEPGTRVLLQPGVSCGRCRSCLDGWDNRCAHYNPLGYMTDGGYAELVTVPIANLVEIPGHIGFTEAAAFPLTFLTAWHMLITRARLQAGEDVLVLAAGSGVGQAAIQIARLHGARVIATAGSAEKLSKAREIGAHETIDHYTDDISAAVKRWTGGRGVDVVVEHVGQATWPRSLKALARGGRVVTCGATTGFNGSLDLRFLFSRQLSVLGSYMGRKAELLQAAPLFFSGALRPVIDRIMPLAEAAEAHRLLEDSQQFGKIVLEV